MKSILFSAVILPSLFFSIYEEANAQSWLWAKSMGGIAYDYGQSIAVDPVTGDVYTTGKFSDTADFDPGDGTFNLTSAGGFDIFITKFDCSGNFVWATSMGGIYDDYGQCIAVDTAGNVYTTGYFYGIVDFDPGPDTFNLTVGGIFISKLDVSGNFGWAKEFWGRSYSLAVDHTGSGGVYATGIFWGTVDFDPGPDTFNLSSYPFDEAIFILKMDGSGNFVWAKAIGGPDYKICRSIAIDPAGSGGVYSTGYFSGTLDFDPGPGIFNLTGPGVFISKLDSSGNFVWAKAIVSIVGVGEADHYIAVDPGSGDVYTTGYFYLTVDFDPGPGTFNLTSVAGPAIFYLKLNSSGNFVWAKAIGGTGADLSSSIALDPDGSGSVYTTGFFFGTMDFDPGAGTFNLTSVGLWDIFISKLDGSGNFEWAMALGDSGFDVGRSIGLDTSGNVHVTGYFESPSISFDSTTLTNTDPGTWIVDEEYGSWYFIITSDIFSAKLGPCTSIVTSTSDSGAGSLRDIISCASNDATITFSLAPMSQITLTSGEIIVDKNLKLNGQSMVGLSISGNNASRIFRVLPEKSLVLVNLSLKNSSAVMNGGAILVEGNLTLESVLLENNSENGTPKGMTVTSTALIEVIGTVDIKN